MTRERAARATETTRSMSATKPSFASSTCNCDQEDDYKKPTIRLHIEVVRKPHTPREHGGTFDITIVVNLPQIQSQDFTRSTSRPKPVITQGKRRQRRCCEGAPQGHTTGSQVGSETWKKSEGLQTGYDSSARKPSGTKQATTPTLSMRRWT